MELKEIISSGLLELYVAGLTSAEENIQVETWAMQYPEVRAEITEIEKATEAFAMANAIEPAAGIKENIMAAVKDQSAAKVVDIKSSISAKRTSPNHIWKWVAAASVVLLIGSSVMNIVYFNRYTTASKGLKETEQLLAQQKQEADQMNEDMGIVKNKYSMPVALNPMPAMPDANAKIFWMKNTGDIYIDPANLPEVPDTMQYQFWAIVDGKPVSGGLIKARDGSTFRMQKMQSFGKAEAFAISLEKAGGNPTPTKVVSMGKII